MYISLLSEVGSLPSKRTLKVSEGGGFTHSAHTIMAHKTYQPEIQLEESNGR